MFEQASTLRRNKKVAGVEDPIVIVQRLLNIFRQMHILSDAQKEEFNKMILSQPPEIRHMCHVLPGGTLLQEYVDDLEAKYGLAPSSSSAPDIANDTILSNALGGNKDFADQASAPNVTESSSNAELKQQMAQMMNALKNLQTQPRVAQTTAPGAEIKLDANFSKDIAGAISAALSVSDEKRSKDTFALAKVLAKTQQETTAMLIKEIRKSATTPVTSISDAAGGQTIKVVDNTQEITKAITESQLEMAKMFLQQNAINANNNNANNANNIQINNMPAANNQDLIADIIKAQASLFREMAQEQTKEISQIIANALKESNQISSKNLVHTLHEFHKENLSFLTRQAQNSNMIFTPIQTPSQPTTDKAFSQPESANDFAESPSSSFQPSTTDENVADQELEEVPTQPYTQKFYNNFSEETSEPDEQLIEDNLPKKKKKKKKKKNQQSAVSPAEFNDADLALGELLGFDTPADDKSKAAPSEDAANSPVDDFRLDDETVFPQTDDKKSLFNKFSADFDDDNSLNSFLDFNDDDSQSQPALEADLKPKDSTLEPTIDFSEPEISDNTDKKFVQNPTYDYEEVPDDADTSAPVEAQTQDTETPEQASDEDWDWEYEEVPDDTNISAPVEAQTQDTQTPEQASDEDWDWEYEEVPDDDTDASAPVEAQTQDTQTPEQTSDEDWDWAYEEVPDEDTDETLMKTNSDKDS